MIKISLKVKNFVIEKILMDNFNLQELTDNDTDILEVIKLDPLAHLLSALIFNSKNISRSIAKLENQFILCYQNVFDTKFNIFYIFNCIGSGEDLTDVFSVEWFIVKDNKIVYKSLIQKDELRCYRDLLKTINKYNLFILDLNFK